MGRYTHDQKEQAARVLEERLEVIEDNTAYNQYSKKQYEEYYREEAALGTAIACLRSPGASPETDGKAGGWVRTSERLPTAADDGEYGVVLAYNKALSREDEMGLAACVRTCVVREGPEWWTYWMRLPALPELPEVDK